MCLNNIQQFHKKRNPQPNECEKTESYDLLQKPYKSICWDDAVVILLNVGQIVWSKSILEFNIRF